MTDKRFQLHNLQRAFILSILMLVGLVVLTDIMTGRVLADGLESGEVGLHANTVSEAYDALTAGAEQVALVLLMVLVVGVVVLGVWSSATQKNDGGGLIKLAAGPSADNLFLAATFHVGKQTASEKSAAKEHLGYVRALRLRNASLVSPVAVRRGDSINLSMSSLPGFPAANLNVEGVVTSVVSMGGEPESFLVQLRFLPLAETERWSIGTYIRELSKRRGALSQA